MDTVTLYKLTSVDDADTVMCEYASIVDAWSDIRPGLVLRDSHAAVVAFHAADLHAVASLHQ